jgi:alpha-amylase/alpha-mannosidase (GH57 family)
MSTYNYYEILSRIQSLSQADQLRLLEDLAAIIRQQAAVSEEPLHSFLELEGLGEEVWRGIDPQKYIEEERKSWRG